MKHLRTKSPSVHIHIDIPSGGLVTSPASVVQGWLAVDGAGSIEHLELVNRAGLVIPLSLIDRPDVRAATPGRTSVGFTGWIDITAAASGPWAVHYQLDGVTGKTALPLRADAWNADGFAAAKARKLSRIRPLLRCPTCHGSLSGDEPALFCVNGHRFRASRSAYDFLDDDVRRHVGAIPTENVSAHGYDEPLLELIGRSAGPILDAGAGLRPDYREDVVNLEIVPYLTTDVVAAAEYLPFVDDAFDVVISVAVLEHVRDPFAAARELERVLRPGGRIFAAVPFLQPYHGYPDHYYNMTAGGLRNLFQNCDVERLEVPASGGPVFLLTWLLQAWRNGLPADVADDFDQMRVADLAVDPMTIVNEPFVRRLPEAINVELAALNVLIGRKRG